MDVVLRIRSMDQVRMRSVGMRAERSMDRSRARFDRRASEDSMRMGMGDERVFGTSLRDLGWVMRGDWSKTSLRKDTTSDGWD